ncbi:MAG: hypothetical protein HGA19_10710, partial [Oscillochloris sp.]|nr:hypothetical protein [Oscillochloris sp.]
LATAQRAGGSSEEEIQQAKPNRKQVAMPGRNDLCPCGSGKKFKSCHLGREDEIMPLIQAAANGKGTQAAGAAQMVQPVRPVAQPVARRDNAGIAAEAAKILQSQQQSQQTEAKPDAQPQPTPRGRSTPRGKKR